MIEWKGCSMGKFETKKEAFSRRETVLTVICGVLALAVVILLVLLWRHNGQQPSVSVYEQGQPAQTTQSAQGSQKEQPSLPDEEAFSVLQSEEQGEFMLVNTTYLKLKYPIAFFDVIRVTENGNAIEFYADLGETVCPIYTIYLSGEGNMTIGTLALADREPTELTAVFHEPIDGLTADELFTFNAARDTFSEVWHSLSENEGFTPID